MTIISIKSQQPQDLYLLQKTFPNSDETSSQKQRNDLWPYFLEAQLSKFHSLENSRSRNEYFSKMDTQLRNILHFFAQIYLNREFDITKDIDLLFEKELPPLIESSGGSFIQQLQNFLNKQLKINQYRFYLDQLKEYRESSKNVLAFFNLPKKLQNDLTLEAHFTGWSQEILTEKVSQLSSLYQTAIIFRKHAIQNDRKKCFEEVFSKCKSMNKMQLQTFFYSLPESVQKELPASLQPPFYGHRVQANLYETYGAHLTKTGASFRVYAPKAKAIHLILKFSNATRSYPMKKINETDYFIEVEGIKESTLYFFDVTTNKGEIVKKIDPYGFGTTLRGEGYRDGVDYIPEEHLASIICDPYKFEWSDQKWMQEGRKGVREGDKPLLIYELFPPNWLLPPSDYRAFNFYSYEDLAPKIIQHCQQMNYTHIELMGILEYPSDHSMGYQISGLFSPSSRHGTLLQFQTLVNKLHKAGIGIILDFIPYHMTNDKWSLSNFDGTPLYNNDDSKTAGLTRDWGTCPFRFSSEYVRNFLISSARFWLEECHIDGIRLDAFNEIINKDYHGKDGAIFIKDLNEYIHREYPNVILIAEDWHEHYESTTPTNQGGFGFDRKWDFPLMHAFMDNLLIAPYDEETRKRLFDRIHLPDNHAEKLFLVKTDPTKIQTLRKYWHDPLARIIEKNIGKGTLCAISHDETKYDDKRPEESYQSLLQRVYNIDPDIVAPDNTVLEDHSWPRFANMRLLKTFQYFLPSNGVLEFMGNEFVQWEPWKRGNGEMLNWKLLNSSQNHLDHFLFMQKLNGFYKQHKAFWSAKEGSFEWINDHHDAFTIYAYHRRGKDGRQYAIIHNASKQGFREYNVRFLFPSTVHNLIAAEEVFNSDEIAYGGTGQFINGRNVTILRDRENNHPSHLQIKLPPLASIVFEETFSCISLD